MKMHNKFISILSLTVLALSGCAGPQIIAEPEISKSSVVEALADCGPAPQLRDKIDESGHFALWRGSLVSALPDTAPITRYFVSADGLGCIFSFEHRPVILSDGYHFGKTPNLYQIRDLTAPTGSIETQSMAFQRFSGSDALAERVIAQRLEFCDASGNAQDALLACQTEIAIWLDKSTARLDFRTSEGSTRLDLINGDAYFNDELVWRRPNVDN